MKALLVRIAAGVIALGAILYFLACTPPTTNNSSVQNQNLSPNQNQANGTKASKDVDKPCDIGSEPGSHAQHIKNEIKDRMGPSLRKLLKDPNNPNGTFTVEVQKAEVGTYFVAHIRGKVSGDDNLKELSNILNDFQNRQECLRVVYFLPDSAGPSAGGPGDGGFEWSACEFPMRVCPNGECCLPTEANTNTNTNTNSNTNTNANGNSNN